MSELEIGRTTSGERFTLPEEIVTETTAIHGIRGSGKTNTATVAVEELLELGHHVVVIDPVDSWWGLKSSGDGEEEGHPVVVLGGPHGDLPLEKDDGKVLADFAVDERVPMVLSLRHMRKKGQKSFVTAFCEQLYHRKGEAKHRVPLLLVIDEASMFIPQRVHGGDARMVGAIEDLVRRGRASGFGVMVIDQRPASVNKDVLTQLEVMVAHQITSPQDRRALDEWVKQHDTEGHRDQFLEDLASLRLGEAYFWSPALDVFEKVQVRKRETFDSSKTPEMGEALKLPETVAELDLDALRGRLEETIEKAKAEDPEHLQKRIQELEDELAAAEEAAGVPEAKVRARVKEAVDEATGPLKERIAELEPEVEHLRARVGKARPLAEELVQALGNGDGLGGTKSPAPAQHKASEADPVPGRDRRAPDSALQKTEPDRSGDPEADDLAGAQWRILDALRRLESVGVEEASRANLAVWSEQSPKSSAYTAHVSDLRKRGLVTYPSSGHVALTSEGRALAGPAEEITSLAELHEAWAQYLDDAQRRILRAVLEAYPSSLSREELAEASDQSPRSSAYTDHVATLRSLGVVEYPEPGHVRAGELLFPEALTR